MNLVFLYGPPAAGKLTVGQELAKLTGFVLFHNHLSIDFARQVLEFRTPAFFKLVDRIRLVVLEEAAKEDVGLIFTVVYVHSLDDAFVDEVFGVVERNGGRVCPVQLTCDVEVLRQRVSLPSRVERRKLATVDGLDEFLTRSNCSEPIPQRQGLRIDTTRLPPQDAAKRICSHFGLASPN